MSSSAGQYWRADGGIQEVPPTTPPPPYTPADPSPAMNWFQGMAWPSPWQQMPTSMQGSMPLAGLLTHAPQYIMCPQPGPYFAPPVYPNPPPAAAPEPAKEETRKGCLLRRCAPPQARKVGERLVTPSAPPASKTRIGRLSSGEDVRLHIFQKAGAIWTGKYGKDALPFKARHMDVGLTPRHVIEWVLGKKGDACKGWAVTEIFEDGDGKWTKGTTIEYGSDKAAGTANSMGWTSKRGEELPPVWLVVHKDNVK